MRYDQVNAMLLNEFLKEHRAFVEEQLKVANQQKEIDALKDELKEQRSLIQKVNDKMELKASATTSGQSRTAKLAAVMLVVSAVPADFECAEDSARYSNRMIIQ